jgi:hypothetical protein
LNPEGSPSEADPARARHFAKIMASGAWHPRDDERVGSDHVMIIDRQHRLVAVVIARQPVELLVRDNWPTENH